jgi:hypothetical protein
MYDKSKKLEDVENDLSEMKVKMWRKNENNGKDWAKNV